MGFGLMLGLGCGSKPEPIAPTYHTIDGFAMGTTWSVQYQGAGGEDATAKLRADVSSLLEKLENSMSTWREDTELSRFNASVSTNWFSMSPELVEVVAAAQKVHQLTQGALDPSVYPLVKLWGFTGVGQPEEIPDARTENEARALVGFERIASRIENPAVRKLNPKMEIDLSAIAKGYAVDRVSRLLGSQQITNHLVEIGGELFGMGLSSKDRPWRVGVELPLVDESEIGQAVELSPGALATSGDYRNSIAIDGKRFAHIVDPRTGRPLLQQGIAVSVLADNCMLADAWATALTVLGVEVGLKQAEDAGIAAHFSRIVDGEMTGRSTSNWKRAD